MQILHTVCSTTLQHRKDFKISHNYDGNINKVFSLSKKKDGKPLSLDLLKDYYKEFSNFTVEERVRVYKMKNDRADVIVPALQIYINIMRWADIEEIYVPKIGIADGLVQQLYKEIRQTQ